jgi:hypothetical protein
VGTWATQWDKPWVRWRVRPREHQTANKSVMRLASQWACSWKRLRELLTATQLDKPLAGK